MINGPAVPAPTTPILGVSSNTNQQVKLLAIDFASALGIVMFDTTQVEVTRYRWRASNIPTPWTSTLAAMAAAT